MKQESLTVINTDKIHTQVYDQLRRLLLDGHWKAGEKIPSENELSRMMGVSRISVRTAIKSLIAQGFLVSRQGDGTFVVDVSIDLNMNVLIPIIGLDEKNVLEVLEYRKIIEVGIIPLFFDNLTDNGIKLLRENLETLENTSETEINRITQLDLGFHSLICQISGNTLIIKVCQILNELFRKTMEESVIHLGNMTGRKYHRKIFEAIVSGDRNMTMELTREHIQDTIDSIEKFHREQENV